MNQPTHMSMKRLASEIGMDRSSCRRYVLSLGVEPVKRRTGDSGFQIALTVTMEQAAKVKKARAEDGYLQLPPEVAAIQVHSTRLAHYSDTELIDELRARLESRRA